MLNNTLLYVLAQTQKETMKKMKAIMSRLEEREVNGFKAKIPNSVKLLLKNGEILMANPLFLLLYSDYFSSLLTLSNLSQETSTNQIACKMISCDDMDLIIDLIFK